MAFVLSSVSGNLISAASAGYAPTNSADVSAIASAYQVVSSTATQLYAGTSYLTGVNAAPISAERAGNAANASLANSAYYDGTGRLISALPDEAAVSAIASAYAESAASSKQDTLSFSYDDDKISAINGSALAGQGGGGGMITSIESSLDPWYQTAISGLNGSSLYPKWTESALSAGYAAAADYATNAYSAAAAPTAWASSFITGVDLSPYQTTADMSGYIPTSLSSDFQQVTGMSSYALSADVSATVDLVGTQSANWGGSALQLSAGPGVKLEKSGNTLVAGLDETVLWSGNTTNITGITLNETYGNFDRVRFYWKPWSDAVAWRVTEIPSFASVFTLDAGWASNAGTGKALFVYSISSNGTAFSQIQGGYQNITGSTSWASSTQCSVVKVVGVNRTAGV